ncbi:MAG: PD-(D/E)XK nuclease family protein [Candidatus Aenigmarchaeota archaeon]|nr:PD-(D/E)XK nuclease family protein [Candidatus Aenigmarchaeota archaeon]
MINVSISHFSSAMGYCQFTAVNRYHLRLKPRLMPHTLAGRALHERLEAEDKLIPREEATKEQLADPFFDLDFTREGVTVSFDRINGNHFRYLGRTDKVIRHQGVIYIIDDKVTSKPASGLYHDRLLQLAAYCEAFIRSYSRMIAFNKVVFNVVHRRPDGGVIQENKVDYTPEVNAILVRDLNTFEGIINKTTQPDHHNNPKKCAPCGFFDQCKWRIESPPLPPGVAVMNNSNSS